MKEVSKTIYLIYIKNMLLTLVMYACYKIVPTQFQHAMLVMMLVVTFFALVNIDLEQTKKAQLKELEENLEKIYQTLVNARVRSVMENKHENK
jgi:hypothetical protein